MDAAWFGLLGVIVGGFISTIWAWLAVVRQEQTDAMVAARLVEYDLASAAHGRQSGDSVTPHSAVWLENRGALARVLGEAEWRAVARVYMTTDKAITDVNTVDHARNCLQSLVAGQRHVIPPRWRKKFRS